MNNEDVFLQGSDKFDDGWSAALHSNQHKNLGMTKVGFGNFGMARELSDRKYNERKRKMRILTKKN